jgi:predicted secreted protein
MNRIYTRGLVWLMVLAIPVCFHSGCKSSKSSTSTKPPSDEQEVVRYCYGPEYNSDKEHFRASAAGESMDQMMSEKKALTESRTKMAAQIETFVKTVTDNYGKSTEMNKKEELMKRYETLTREVVNQKLSGTIEICNKQTKTKEGNYKTYLTLELGGNDVLSALNSKISNDDMLKIDYNYEKFKKTFEDEMNKMQPK